MRIALIGIGKISNYQMQAISHTLGITLTDVHDLDLVKAEELPGSIQFYDDLETMLKRSTADAFLVSTPGEDNKELSKFSIDYSLPQYN